MTERADIKKRRDRWANAAALLLIESAFRRVGKAASREIICGEVDAKSDFEPGNCQMYATAAAADVAAVTYFLY